MRIWKRRVVVCVAVDGEHWRKDVSSPMPSGNDIKRKMRVIP